MEFFNGSIEQAVTLSKSKNAVFVVFVEGPSTDEKSKLRELIDDTQIRSKLQSDDFVVIKVTSDSQAYMQFAAIYQVVPVPSLFFIGKSGQPLEIATDTLKTIDELEEKVIRVLKLSGKSTPQAGGAGTSSSSSSAFIAAEQVAAAAVAPVAAEVPAKEAPKKEEIEPAVAAKADVEAEAPKTEKAAEPEVAAAPNSEPEKAAAEPEKVADDVDMKEAATEQTPTVAAPAPAVADIPKPKETQAATAPKVVKPTPAQPTVAASAAATAAEQRSAGVSPVQSQEAIKRPPVVDLKELERLKKEQELKELKDSLKRDRLLEQQARERIRAQIAGDRAERAQRKEDTESNASTAANRGTSPTSTSGGVAQQKSKSFNISDPDNTCLQFRLPSGDHHTHIFQASQLLSDVRAFVKMDLLSGSGIRDFYLATSYPRREFGAEDDENTLLQLGLVPNAVILVIAKESKISPANIVARSGGILNLLSSLMTMIFTPFFSVFDYMRSYFRKRPAPDAPQEEPNDAAKRRNLDNLNMGPSTSRAAALGDLSRFNVAGGGHASGTGSAGGGGQSTGNGNVDGGTKPYRRFGGSNIHRLNDSRKDSDDENATWNGNSTQQQ